MLLYGAILAIINLSLVTPQSQQCIDLEERLNLSIGEKKPFNLHKCGGNHNTNAVNHQFCPPEICPRNDILNAPWSAAIWIWNNRTEEFTHHCGASIINEMYILTAAHCLENQKISDLKVIVGLDIPRLKNCPRKKDVEYDITKTYIHSDYDFPYFDVGILELQRKLEYTRGITLVCRSKESTNILEDDAVSLFGWGATRVGGKPSPVLRKGNYRVMKIKDCKDKIEKFTFAESSVNVSASRNRSLWLREIDGQKSMEGLMCIEDIEANGLLGTCGGDSGSPVVKWASLPHSSDRRYEQIGIVSGGICGSGKPSVLTHIDHPKVLTFIDETINGELSEYISDLITN